MDVVAFNEGLAAETDADLERELLTLNAHMSAATYRFLMLVRAFDARVAWGDFGMRSMAHWLNWRCGIDLGAAREQVRVAHALSGLPRTGEALAHGRISYSKVRALSRIATAENEDFFLDVAEHGTASHMEKIVRYVRSGMALNDAARLRAMVEQCTCDWYHDDDGMLVLRARLMPDEGARLVKAIRSLEGNDTARPLASRRASALAMVAEAACAEEVKRSVPEIVVHLRAERAEDASGNHVDDVSAGHAAVIEDAVAISTVTAERLCCDAAVVPILEDGLGEPLAIGRRSRTIPPAIRRAMNARDQGCRFPGCNHTRFLHGHHIRHWAHQGETSLANLVTLCSYHHTLVHEGGFGVERLADGSIEWRTPRSKRISAAQPTCDGSTHALIHANTSRGLDVSAATCDSKWDGLPADYDLVLTAFFSRPEATSALAGARG